MLTPQMACARPLRRHSVLHPAIWTTSSPMISVHHSRPCHPLIIDQCRTQWRYFLPPPPPPPLIPPPPIPLTTSTTTTWQQQATASCLEVILHRDLGYTWVNFIRLASVRIAPLDVNLDMALVAALGEMFGRVSSITSDVSVR